MFKGLKVLLFVMPLTFVQQYIYAQNCENLGFDDGTFNGWTLTYGNLSEVGGQAAYSTETIGTRSEEHIITTPARGNDPNITDEAIPQVAPGSRYSCRIGYVVQGNRYDRLKKSFRVTADNALFQFSYAILLEQDPSRHQNWQKPGFSVKMVDAAGNALKCSNYDIQLQANTVANGFKTQTITGNRQVQYRNWTTASMDLKDYIGQTLTLIVEVRGCTGRAHFGYAYFDAKCFKSEITPLGVCPDRNGDIFLKAPDGFAKYTWQDGDPTQIGKVKAVLGSTHSVKLRPFTSQSDDCDFKLDYKIKYGSTASTVKQTICYGEQLKVEDTPYSATGTYFQTISRFNVCDSFVTLNLKVIPKIEKELNKIICEGESFKVGTSVYKTSGVFKDIIKHSIAGENIACDSVVTTNLTVDKALQISLPERYEVDLGSKIQLNPTIAPAGQYFYKWSPPTGLSCANCPNPWLQPLEPMAFTFTIRNAFDRCPQEYQTKISLSNTLLEIPTAFSPNGDGVNDVFFVFGNSDISIVNEFQIFDRWGTLVFENKDFPVSDPTHGWNGKIAGRDANAEMYAFKVMFTLDSGVVRKMIGNVVLLR
jgi:gliding motility-associated-like protein